jgi:hypothetical protein
VFCMIRLSYIIMDAAQGGKRHAPAASFTNLKYLRHMIQAMENYYYLLP